MNLYPSSILNLTPQTEQSTFEIYRRNNEHHFKIWRDFKSQTAPSGQDTEYQQRTIQISYDKLPRAVSGVLL